MWLSPPSPWIGSAMKQAMSCGCAANAASACASARRSAATTSRPRRPAGSGSAGTSMRGQSNFGKQVGLDRVGVGQRERVAAAAVEGLAQVQHLRAELRRRGRAPRCGGASSRTRSSARSRRPAPRPRRRTGAAARGRRARARTSRRTPRGASCRCRSCDGLLTATSTSSVTEVRVVGQRRVVHAQRRGGEEAEQVEVAARRRARRRARTRGWRGCPARGRIRRRAGDGGASRGRGPVSRSCLQCPAVRNAQVTAPGVGLRQAKCHDVGRAPDESSARRAGPPPARAARGRRPGRPWPSWAGRRAVAHGGARPGAAAGADRGDPRLPGGRRAARPLAIRPPRPGRVW